MTWVQLLVCSYLYVVKAAAMFLLYRAQTVPCPTSRGLTGGFPMKFPGSGVWNGERIVPNTAVTRLVCSEEEPRR